MRSLVLQGGSPPTFLSLGAAANIDNGAGAEESDIVLFRPLHADEPLHGKIHTVHDTDTSRVDHTVEYFDSIGRRVAEVYLSGHEDAPDPSGRLREELVCCVVDRFGVAKVRRFRSRITGSTTGEPINCTVRVLQRYRTDHEWVQDISVVCATESGTVVARAWVTVADDAQMCTTVDGIPA